MTAPYTAPYPVEIAITTLSQRDSQLAALFDRVGRFRLPFRTTSTPYQELLRSIVYQQLSTRAACTIHNRLLDLFLRRYASANRMATLTDDALRTAGLSRAKVRAVRSLTEAALNKTLPSRRALAALDDQAIIKRLITLHGIGHWTIEMLLIFHMGRPDVLPSTDLGIRRGFMLMSEATQFPSPAALLQNAERWRPYRSVAAWYLWRANDL